MTRTSTASLCSTAGDTSTATKASTYGAHNPAGTSEGVDALRRPVRDRLPRREYRLLEEEEEEVKEAEAVLCVSRAAAVFVEANANDASRPCTGGLPPAAAVGDARGGTAVPEPAGATAVGGANEVAVVPASARDLPDRTRPRVLVDVCGRGDTADTAVCTS